MSDFDFAVGRTLADGRYVVEALIGRGGMAAVYQVRHTQLDSLLAVKVMTATNPSLRARMLREGKAQGALRHPNVVSVFDVIQIQGLPALVMELVDGPALDQVLAAHRCTLDQADWIARGILDGMCAAHELGLIHRDLKPGNVLMGLSGRGVLPKVADFGLVKRAFDESVVATKTGAVMGTPAYMPPEQIKDAGKVDERADVFSVAAMLYEIVTGQRCFQGADLFSIQEAIVYGRFRPPAELVDLPDRMSQAILGGLACDPNDRIPTMRAFRTLWEGDVASPDAKAIWPEDTLQTLRELRPVVTSAAAATPVDTFEFQLDGSVPAEPTAPPVSVSTMDPTVSASTLAPVETASERSAPRNNAFGPSALLGAAAAAVLLGAGGGWATHGTLWGATNSVGVDPSPAVSALLAAEEGTMAYFEEAAPTTLNPLYARSMVDTRTHTLIFERLFYRVPVTSELSSRLVDDYESSDDGRIMTLNLRDDVVWHDGERFSAEDVCFTHAAMVHPDNASPLRVAAEEVLDCRVRGITTVELEFARVLKNPRLVLDWFVLPEHIFDGNPVVPAKHSFSSKPVGLGAMMAEQLVDHVRFDAHPHEEGRRLQTVLMSYGQDPFQQFRALMDGSVHGIVNLAPPFRPDVAASDHIGMKNYDQQTWLYVAVNHRSEPLGHAGIRSALDHSLNRTELVELTVGVDPNDPNPPTDYTSGPFVTNSPYYNRQVEEPAFLPAEAHQEMLDAGAHWNGEAWLIGAKPITLRLGMYAPIETMAMDLHNQVANQLRAAGFQVEASLVSHDDWYAKVLTGQARHDYDLLLGAQAVGLSEDIGPLFHSRFRGQGTQNIFAYSNPEVDRLLQEYETAATDFDGGEAYRSLHVLLAEDRPYLYLWQHNVKSAWSNKVRGNTISPYDYFTEFRNWRMPEPR